ncbi:hypothetical protein T439DRAFT_382431 [Meredithblackwellia eburnea MCA 4105]
MRGTIALVTSTLLALLLPTLSSAHQQSGNHTRLAIDLNNKGSALHKRGFSGKGSFYAPGQGACGGWNSASDSVESLFSSSLAPPFIVALNFEQYGDPSAVSPYCFKQITISYGGKTHSAQIVDACQLCGYGGIDLSPSLFSYFADQSVGIIYLEWSVNGGGDSGGQSTTKAPQQAATSSDWQDTSDDWGTSTSSQWTPSSTTPPPTYASTTTAPVVSNSTLTSTNSSLPLSTSSLNSTSLGNNSTTPPSTGDDVGSSSSNRVLGGNLDLLNQVVIGLGSVVASQAQVAALRQ